MRALGRLPSLLLIGAAGSAAARPAATFPPYLHSFEDFVDVAWSGPLDAPGYSGRAPLQQVEKIEKVGTAFHVRLKNQGAEHTVRAIRLLGPSFEMSFSPSHEGLFSPAAVEAWLDIKIRARGQTREELWRKTAALVDYLSEDVSGGPRVRGLEGAFDLVLDPEGGDSSERVPLTGERLLVDWQGDHWALSRYILPEKAWRPLPPEPRTIAVLDRLTGHLLQVPPPGPGASISTLQTYKLISLALVMDHDRGDQSLRAFVDWHFDRLGLPRTPLLTKRNRPRQALLFGHYALGDLLQVSWTPLLSVGGEPTGHALLEHVDRIEKAGDDFLITFLNDPAAHRVKAVKLLAPGAQLDFSPNDGTFSGDELETWVEANLAARTGKTPDEVMEETLRQHKALLATHGDGQSRAQSILSAFELFTDQGRRELNRPFDLHWDDENRWRLVGDRKAGTEELSSVKVRDQVTGNQVSLPRNARGLEAGDLVALSLALNPDRSEPMDSFIRRHQAFSRPLGEPEPPALGSGPVEVRSPSPADEPRAPRPVRTEAAQRRIAHLGSEDSTLELSGDAELTVQVRELDDLHHQDGRWTAVAGEHTLSFASAVLHHPEGFHEPSPAQFQLEADETSGLPEAQRSERLRKLRELARATKLIEGRLVTPGPGGITKADVAIRSVTDAWVKGSILTLAVGSRRYDFPSTALLFPGAHQPPPTSPPWGRARRATRTSR